MPTHVCCVVYLGELCAVLSYSVPRVHAYYADSREVSKYSEGPHNGERSCVSLTKVVLPLISYSTVSIYSRYNTACRRAFMQLLTVYLTVCSGHLHLQTRVLLLNEAWHS